MPRLLELAVSQLRLCAGLGLELPGTVVPQYQQEIGTRIPVDT